MKQSTPLLLLAPALMLIAGCSYKVPLTEEHTIPIDQKLIGPWVAVDDVEKDCEKQESILVIQFSETEYVVCFHTDTDGNFYMRGYPVQIGGVSCVQIQLISPLEFEPGSSEEKEYSEKRFAVAKYEIRDDTLEVSVLSDDVVDGEIDSSEALREAFMKNISDDDLFEEPSSFLRYEGPDQ